MVDVEADGPVPGDYSMVALGAIVAEPGLEKTFYARLRPVSRNYLPEYLAVTGFTREQTLAFEEPAEALQRFDLWLHRNSRGQPAFVSDNAGFDWGFVAWYCQHFLQFNPFGTKALDLDSFYKGCSRSLFKNFRRLRMTPHTHHPVDDARGNAEAFLTILREYRVRAGAAATGDRE